jgi:hypothetical protein
MVKEITNANDVELDIAGETKVPVSDFSISRTEDSSEIHGSAHAEPRGYTRGNITYEVSITLEGEVTEVMNGVVEDRRTGRSAEVEVVATGDHYKWTVRGVLFTDEEFSASDGDVVEYSADGLAVSVEREELTGSDL